MEVSTQDIIFDVYSLVNKKDWNHSINVNAPVVRNFGRNKFTASFLFRRNALTDKSGVNQRGGRVRG